MICTKCGQIILSAANHKCPNEEDKINTNEGELSVGVNIDLVKLINRIRKHDDENEHEGTDTEEQDKREKTYDEKLDEKVDVAIKKAFGDNKDE